MLHANRVGKLRTPARDPAVKFVVGSADVDVDFIVAHFAHDVAAEQVASEFSSGVPIHEANFAAGVEV
jgi:hypothetical protein